MFVLKIFFAISYDYYVGKRIFVTVVVLSVCLSVCVFTTILALQATRSDTNSFSATRARKITWRFC